MAKKSGRQSGSHDLEFWQIVKFEISLSHDLEFWEIVELEISLAH